MPRRLAALAAMLLLLAGCSSEPPSLPTHCQGRSTDKIGGNFSLTNHNGEKTSQKDFLDRETLVFFGFTYCPDVCPSTLYMLGQALETIPEQLQPHTIMITIDPERDSPELLAKYIRNHGFPKNITGLTGTSEEIAAVAKAFAAGYSRFDDPKSSAGYSMDHTSIIYLMDREWKLKTFFTHGTTPELLAQCLGQVIPGTDQR